MNQPPKCSRSIFILGVLTLVSALAAPIFWILVEVSNRFMLLAELWYFAGFDLILALLGGVLVAISFFPKRVCVPLSSVSNVYTWLSTSLLSVVCATGLYCVCSWIIAVAFQEATLRYPLEELFGCLGGIVCSLLAMVLLIAWGCARIHLWSKKGLLLDLWWMAVLFLPASVMVELFHKVLSAWEAQYGFISRFLFAIGVFSS